MSRPAPRYTEVFDRDISDLFRRAWRQTLANPRLARFFLSTVRRQQRAARRRLDWRKNGLAVPPVVIVSITNRCNLKCRGCYAHALRSLDKGELAPDAFKDMLKEAGELGISIVMLAGGEPLLRPELLDITRDFPDILFPVFTNGTMIDDAWVARFRRQGNLIVIASIEGAEAETDARRGAGIYARLKALAGRVRGKGIFWGCSLTVTSRNLDTLVGEDFVRRLIDAGCGAFIFVEYVPVQAGTDGLALTPDQKATLVKRLEELRGAFPALFIGFPGDEERYGGCLAAGRGFVHVAASGAVEACPFAPYSDTSLPGMTLRQALGSKLLETIRANHDKLGETKGGCALWENREWVRGLAEKAKAEVRS